MKKNSVRHALAEAEKAYRLHLKNQELDKIEEELRGDENARVYKQMQEAFQHGLGQLLVEPVQKVRFELKLTRWPPNEEEDGS